MNEEAIAANRQKCEERVLYVLRLEDECYYIGQSRKERIETRLRKHFKGKGSAWTQLHPPIEIIEQTAMVCDYRGGELQENQKTIEYMKKYGIDKVRGGFFSNCDLDITTKNLHHHGYFI